MTVLRCTAKLLKRMRQPAKLPEPEPHTNPLGEWYADVDFWRRQPFVVLINAATGAGLVLPGDAANLRRLHERALLQFAALSQHVGLHGAGVDAELNGFHTGFTCANTRDRSLLSTLNQRKYGSWMGFEHNHYSFADSALLDWEGMFKHPSLTPGTGRYRTYHRPLDLVRQRLMPAAEIIPFPSKHHRNPGDGDACGGPGPIS